MLHRHPTLPSTMTEASRLALAGAPHGDIVLALEQTSGQGRQGRTWLSAPGDGLYCTFILRLAVDPNSLPCLTLALGLAVSETITQLIHQSSDIRWPNDILLNGKKVSGILARYEQGAVLAGIGINLNQTNFPKDLRTPATSLHLETTKTFDPENVLATLEPNLHHFTQLDRAAILRLFTQASSYVTGRRVTVDSDGQITTGITDGLDEFGFLRLLTPNGRRHTVLSGSVRPAD